MEQNKHVVRIGESQHKLIRLAAHIDNIEMGNLLNRLIDERFTKANLMEHLDSQWPERSRYRDRQYEQEAA